MTHGRQTAETNFTVELNGVDNSAKLITHSIAKGESKQVFNSNICGNNQSYGHTECDAILMDNGHVKAVPSLEANNLDASLVHEAAIGKIAGDQLIKLMTLGLTEAQAEEQIAKTGANEISITATGNGVENDTKSIISAMSTSTGEGVTGFDVKA